MERPSDFPPSRREMRPQRVGVSEPPGEMAERRVGVSASRREMAERRREAARRGVKIVAQGNQAIADPGGVMKRYYYYPKTWGALLPFLQNLSAKAPHYVAQLNVTPAELDFLNRMGVACAALVNFQHQAKNFAEDWTRLRDQCFDGATTAPPPAWPAWNGPATPPVALESGCNIKLRALLHRWKTAAGYNDAIGENLGLVGPVIAVDAVGAQPELRVKLVAGRPEISASVEHFDAVELEVDRGEGFALLDVSTGPPVRDAHPLPAVGTSAVWTYRGILRAKNMRVGQWSPVVVVPVLGI